MVDRLNSLSEVYPLLSIDYDTQEKQDVKMTSLISDEDGTASSSGDSYQSIPVPDMWSKDYIGLYSQYAAVGLMFGSGGTLFPFCVYAYDGPANVCANARSIALFAWSIKIVFALITDLFRPFGMRRKPFMLFGWICVLILLMFLAIAADKMSVSVWLITLLFSQCFMMLSDVPADGYTVELGRLEPLEQRGQILATAQRIRYTFCVIAGLIESCLLNGPSTNDSDCEISFTHCWTWGLTINQYYGLLFALIFILTIPIIWMKELDSSSIPKPSFSQFTNRFWTTLKNLTTFYLIIFVVGSHALTNFYSTAQINLQYYVIKLTHLQIGIDTITTYSALVFAIWIFQKYLINRNWRTTQYVATIFSSLLALAWIAPFHNAGGTMNGWFTIFIDVDTYFFQGLTKVLYSMAVIELALPGQEATTLEFIVTCGNAAMTVNSIIATQLLTPLNAVSCDDDNDHCPSNTVDLNDPSTFNATDGPSKYTNYQIILSCIAIVATFLFTPFLPSSKDECYQWKKKGEISGASRKRGYLTLGISIVIIGYGLISSILLLDVHTACQPAIGGAGC